MQTATPWLTERHGYDPTCAGVVTTRNHVRYVVTEYGVADLYGKTIRQRARQLIGIAHPDFRADLEKQAKELHYL